LEKNLSRNSAEKKQIKLNTSIKIRKTFEIKTIEALMAMKRMFVIHDKYNECIEYKNEYKIINQM
jgi:hypothetical protein